MDCFLGYPTDNSLNMSYTGSDKLSNCRSAGEVQSRLRSVRKLVAEQHPKL